MTGGFFHVPLACGFKGGVLRTSAILKPVSIQVHNFEIEDQSVHTVLHRPYSRPGRSSETLH